MSLGIRQLTAGQHGYTPAIVEWKVIRKHFVQVRKALELNQHDIQGVPQPLISKLETNDNLGPQVETFVKAIEGMGITVSSFFLQIERQTESSLRALPTSATKEGLNPTKLEGAHDPSVPPTRGGRRALLIDVGQALLDAAAQLPDDPGQQDATTRTHATKQTKSARRSRRSLAR